VRVLRDANDRAGPEAEHGHRGRFLIGGSAALVWETAPGVPDAAILPLDGSPSVDVNASVLLTTAVSQRLGAEKEADQAPVGTCRCGAAG